MDRRGVVVIVENDRQVSDRIGGWLREDGFDVRVCAGPAAPDYRCAGAQAPCPLVRAADLIVLDLWLASDRAIAGMSSRGLLRRYVSTQKPVVAFTHRPGELMRFPEENLVEMEWPPDRRDILETTRALFRRWTEAPACSSQRSLCMPGGHPACGPATDLLPSLRGAARPRGKGCLSLEGSQPLPLSRSGCSLSTSLGARKCVHEGDR